MKIRNGNKSTISNSGWAHRALAMVCALMMLFSSAGASAESIFHWREQVISDPITPPPWSTIVSPENTEKPIPADVPEQGETVMPPETTTPSETFSPEGSESGEEEDRTDSSDGQESGHEGEESESSEGQESGQEGDKTESSDDQESGRATEEGESAEGQESRQEGEASESSDDQESGRATEEGESAEGQESGQEGEGSEGQESGQEGEASESSDGQESGREGEGSEGQESGQEGKASESSEGDTTDEETSEESESTEKPEFREEDLWSNGILTWEGEGFTLTMGYPQDALIPYHSVLNVEERTGADLYSSLKKADKLLRKDPDSPWQNELQSGHFFSVVLLDADGNELVPDADVTLTIRLTSGETEDDNSNYSFFDLTGWELLEPDSSGAVSFHDYRGEILGFGIKKQVQVGTVTKTYTDKDYMVVASYGPEAGFPANTELKVREIRPGTEEYALYSGQTEEVLGEEWSEITMQRYFDISFISGGRELEPEADIDVQIVFRSAIREDEEHEVSAVHIESDDTATVIDMETDSTLSAKRKPDAIDTVTFSSENFSVYGVIQRKKITSKILADDGNTYSINITYGPEANIPEGAEIKVEEIDQDSNKELWEAYRRQTAAALNADDVRLPGLYDISIVHEGEPVHPDAPVNVSITLDNATEGADLQVVHFKEELTEEQAIQINQAAQANQAAQKKPESSLAAPTADETVTEQGEADQSETTTTQTESTQGESNSSETDSIQEEITGESHSVQSEIQLQNETIAAQVEPQENGTTVTFDTDSFSVYAFAYTVDFEYIDVQTGESYAWSFPGRGSYPLTEILNQIHKSDEVITGANLKLIEGEDHPGALYLSKDEATDAWSLNSDSAFTDIYQLTILTENGGIVLQVTDDQQPIQIQISFLGLDEEIDTNATIDNIYLIIEQWDDGSNCVWSQKIEPVNGEQRITLDNQLNFSDNLGVQHDISNSNLSFGNMKFIQTALSEEDLRKQLAVYNNNDITIIQNDSLLGIYKVKIDNNISTSGIISFICKKQPAYSVDIAFTDNAGNPANPEGNYYVYASTLMPDNGTDATFWSIVPVTCTDGTCRIDIMKVSRTNAQPAEYSYSQILQSDKELCCVLVKHENEFFVEQNDMERGTIKYGTTIEDGTFDGTYIFTATTTDDGIQFVANPPQTLTYSITVKKNDGTDTGINPDLNNADWYIQATVDREDGRYSYTEKISDKFVNGVANGSVSIFYRQIPYMNDNQIAYREVPTPYHEGENVTFALLKPKEAVTEPSWKYFSDGGNINTNAMSGSDVESRYTLNIDSADHVLTLQEAPNAKIILTTHSGTTPDTAEDPLELDTTNGQYYLVGEMFVQNGKSGYNAYAVQELSNAAIQTAEITNGLMAYTDQNSWRAEYVTGKRSVEPLLAYVPDSAGISTTEQLLEALKSNSDQITIYRDDEPVEGYKLFVEQQGSLGNSDAIPTAKLHLVKLQNLTMNNMLEGESTLSDTAYEYYTLTEITRGAKKAYTLTPFYGTMQNTAITGFETETGEKLYYQDGDVIANYVVRVSSGTELTVQEAIGKSKGTRYSEGQLMGSYIPSFTRQKTAITTTLTRVSNEGSNHTVYVQLYDKDNQAVSEADPCIQEQYYVLAYLTPQNTGTKGQVIGWNAFPIDMGKKTTNYENGVETVSTEDGLNTKGVYSHVIPVSNGFYAVDTDLVNTGDTLGYDSELYDLNLRMIKRKNNWEEHLGINDLGYADLRNKEIMSDEAPSGYDFITPTIGDNTTGKSEIKLRSAYEKEYRIRVDVEDPELVISESEQIYVRVAVEHYSGNYSYGFYKLVVDEGDQHTYLEPVIDNGNNYALTDITGNERGAELMMILMKRGASFSYGELIKSPDQFQNMATVIQEGASINKYTFSYGVRETQDADITDGVGNVTEKKTVITDVIRFMPDHGDISKGEIDSYLEMATNFGLYTENLSVHGTDMESNIGAARLSGQIGDDYGFSGNNLQVNRIKVVKHYPEAPEETSVVLRLYRAEINPDGTYVQGEKVAEVSNTIIDGSAVLEFSGLTAGSYILKEVFTEGGTEKEYSFSSPRNEDNAIVTEEGITVSFNEELLVIQPINVNVNYFGTIDPDVDLSSVIRHSRNGIIVTEKEENDPNHSYSRLIAANNGRVQTNLGTIYEEGSAEHPTKYDIPTDMANLRTLSSRLGNTTSSQTVKIMEMTLDEVNQSSATLIQGDGRFVVLNIDVTGKGSSILFDPFMTYNGTDLRADFGQEGSEYASKILYNFITRDAHGTAHPYTGRVSTSREGSGVLLVPAGIVGDLGANWGGTIICKEAQHTGSEIHSDSANKIQNINTVLTNSKSSEDNGKLEIRKSILGESMDHTTWFTMEVTLKNSTGEDVTESYVASGLKEGTTVSFVNGKARIQVRAQNKVLITGIPVNYTYTVREISRPESDHYQLIQIVDASGNVVDGEAGSFDITAEGMISKGQTDVVNVVNAHKVGGLTIGKTVVGDDTGLKKFTFRVTLEENGEITKNDFANKYFGSLYFDQDGVAEFELGNGEFRTAKDIPTGTKFTVQEVSANQDKFTTSVRATVLVPEGKINPCVVYADTTVTGEIIENAQGDKIAIILSYKNSRSEAASYTPKIRKFLKQDGNDADDTKWPAEGISFTLSPETQDGAIASSTTAKATASNKVATFGMITFSKAGTYTYTITERDDGVGNTHEKNGVLYNLTPLTLEIVVQDLSEEHDNSMLIVSSVWYGSDSEPITTNLSSAVGEIINTWVDHTGSLSISKQVTVNGKAPETNEEKSLTNGTYSFIIYDEDGSNPATKADGSQIGTLQIQVTDGIANPTSLTVDGLAAGTYVVKETSMTNTSAEIVTTSAGYVSEKGGVVVDVQEQNTANIPIAVLVNNIETTSFTVNKTWSDNNNESGYRPDSITVKLLADNEETGITVTLNEENDWSASIDNLVKKNNGVEITYSWEEETVTGYTTDQSEAEGITTITNTVEKTDVTVNKTFYPELNAETNWSATFQLQSQKKLVSIDGITATPEQIGDETGVDEDGWSEASEVSGKTITLDNNKASDTFTDLPKYTGTKNGNELKIYELRYTVAETSLTINEEDKLNEYIATVTPGQKENSYAIAIENKPDQNRMSLNIQKIWEGGNAPKDASIEVIVKRYRLVEKTPEYGTLTISDSISGMDEGDIYTVSYSMDGSSISSGTAVPVGDHTIVKTVTFDEEKYTADRTSETIQVYVTTEGGTGVFSGTTFTKRSGTLTINDPAPTGLDSGDAYTVTYKIGDEVVNTGTTLTVGTYTVTKTVSGYDTDTYNATYTDESYTVTITKDGGTAEFHQTVFTEKQTTGSIIIRQSLTGETNGASYYNANYAVLKNGIQVASGTYTGTTGATINNLTPGNDYSIELACTSLDTSMYTVEEASINQNNVSVSSGNETTVMFVNKINKMGGDIYHKVCIHAVTTNIDELAQCTKYYTFEHGTNVTLKFLSNGWDAYGNDKTICVDNSDEQELKNNTTITFTVNHDVDVAIDGTGYSTWQPVIQNMTITPAPSNNSRKIKYYGMLAVNGVSDVNYNAVTAQADVTKITLTTQNNNTNPSYEGYNLIADENWFRSVTLTSSSWSQSISNLEIEDEDGNQYIYYIESVTETDVPEGIAVSFTTDEGKKQVVHGTDGNRTLSLTDIIPKTELGVTKTWDDNNNAAGIRPESITVSLSADGTVVKTKTLNESNNWSARWDDLDIYNTYGNLITYTISENEVTGYSLKSKTYDSETCTFNLENTPATANLNIIKNLTKVNTSGADLTFHVGLFTDAEGTILATDVGENPQSIIVPQNAASGTVSFSGLSIGNTYYVFETLANGMKVSRTDKQNGYSISASSVGGVKIVVGTDTTATLTNQYSASGVVPFKAKKTFKNGTLTEGQFTFTLTETDANGEVLEGGVSQSKTNDSNGDIVFDNVSLTDTTTRYFVIAETIGNDPSIIYAVNKQQIVVTVTDDGAGTLSYTKDPAEGNGYDAYFVNEQLGQISIRKTFSGNVPETDYESQKGNLRFHVVGTEYDHTFTYGTNDVANNATWENGTLTITNLPIGESYTVTETGDTFEDANSVPYIHTYTMKVDGVDATEVISSLDGNTIVIDNRYDQAKLEITKTVTGLPESGTSVTYSFTVTGDGLITEGLTRTRIYPNDFSSGPCTITLTQVDGIKPEVTYTVTETASSANVIGYTRTTTVSSTSFTQVSATNPTGTVTTDEAGNGTITFTNNYLPETVEIPVRKMWLRNDGTTVTRWPTGVASVTVQLYRGEIPINDNTLLLTENNNDGTAKFTNLPKYEFDDDGTATLITDYTVKEAAVSGYTGTVSGTIDTGFTITNTPKTTQVTVKKVWTDDTTENHNADQVIVQLKANGENSGDPVTLKYSDDTSNSWTHTWIELPVVDDTTGQEIIYTLEEVGYTVANDLTYTATISSLTKDPSTDNYFITLTNTPGNTVTVEAVKTWTGGQWPESVTVEFQLQRNGENYREPIMISSETPDHKAVWDKLPEKDLNGTNYNYTVVETVKIDTVALVKGTDYNAGEWSITTNESITTWEINNEMIPVSVSGRKTWYDKDSTKTHANASEITLTLTRTSANVTTAESVSYDTATQLIWDGYTYTINGLDKYDSQGAEYTYIVTEQEVPNYYTVTKGNDFINIEKTTVEATKAWSNGVSAVVWPVNVESVTFTLYATVGDGTEQVVNTFTETNPSLAGIIPSIIKTDTTKAQWNDLPVKVLVGSEWQNVEYCVKETAVIYNDGTAAIATHEEAVAKYGSVNTDNTITNTIHVISVTGIKQWKTAENTPAATAVEFTLYASDGKTIIKRNAYGADLINPVKIDGSSDWKITFTDLPADGTYVIRETAVWFGETKIDDVSEYFTVNEEGTAALNVTTTDGTIINTPASTTIEVTKEWSPAAPDDGTTIVLGLYNSTDLDKAISTITLNGTPEAATADETHESYSSGNTPDNYEDSAWHAKWTNLPKYINGTEIVYVVQETVPAGYTVSYGEAGATYASANDTITNTLNETNIKIIKIEQGSSPQVRLTGAKFKLYRLTNETTVDDNGGSTQRIVETPYPNESGYELETDNQGEITFTNLIDGDYKIIESQAPTGYNILSGNITFTIRNGKITTTNADGTVISFTAAEDGESDIFTVGNTPGVELPATGGSGTLWYTISGLAMIVLAGILLVNRRQRHRR